MLDLRTSLKKAQITSTRVHWKSDLPAKAINAYNSKITQKYPLLLFFFSFFFFPHSLGSSNFSFPVMCFPPVKGTALPAQKSIWCLCRLDCQC